MSLSFLVKEKNLEYSGKGVRGVFSYKKNLLNTSFIKMFYEIIKFYNKSSKLDDIDENLNLGSFLQKEKMSDFFINYHILPMVSAIWSMPPDNAKNMPIKFFLKFFQNHGLFKFKDRPQWYTVKNRSIEYVNKVIKKISGEHFKNYKINKVTRSDNATRVFYGGESEYFEYDKVVIATHADEALSIIDSPSNDEKDILSNFKYKKNLAVIHSDETVMPQKKINWSAWNTFVSENNDSSVTYWLNLLQNLNIEKNIFLTLNPHFNIDEKLIVETTTSWCFVGPGLRLSMELFGPEYSMFVNTLDTDLKVFFSREVSNHQGEDLIEKQNAESGQMPVVSSEADVYGYTAENRHMVECFLKGVRPKENFSDGVAITELLMTAYMSAEQGVTIKFPPPGLDQFVPMVAKGKWNPKKQ